MDFRVHSISVLSFASMALIYCWTSPADVSYCVAVRLRFDRIRILVFCIRIVISTTLSIIRRWKRCDTTSENKLFNIVIGNKIGQSLDFQPVSNCSVMTTFGFGEEAFFYTIWKYLIVGITHTVLSGRAVWEEFEPRNCSGTCRINDSQMQWRISDFILRCWRVGCFQAHVFEPLLRNRGGWSKILIISPVLAFGSSGARL